MKPQANGTPRPVTVYVPSGQLMGKVVRSEDSRLALGTPVGLRLADMEGILEPSATVHGVVLQIAVLSHKWLPDLSSEVAFELLDASSESKSQQAADGV